MMSEPKKQQENQNQEETDALERLIAEQTEELILNWQNERGWRIAHEHGVSLSEAISEGLVDMDDII